MFLCSFSCSVSGCCQAPVFVLGQSARKRFPAGWGWPQVAEWTRWSPTEAAGPGRSQQDPGSPAMAAHENAYWGITRYHIEVSRQWEFGCWGSVHWRSLHEQLSYYVTIWHCIKQVDWLTFHFDDLYRISNEWRTFNPMLNDRNTKI